MFIPDRLIAGIDEVGRGCIAGPVLAATVILDQSKTIQNISDSKTISSRKRQILSKKIQLLALDFSIGRVEPSEIDRINVLQASLLAMQRAFLGLKHKPHWVYVDGNKMPDLPCHGEAVIKADQSIPAVSAASILAKVCRDQEMCYLDKLYSGYGFSQHKGYPTKTHLLRMSLHGVTAIHRASFAPVKKIILKI